MRERGGNRAQQCGMVHRHLPATAVTAVGYWGVGGGCKWGEPGRRERGRERDEAAAHNVEWHRHSVVMTAGVAGRGGGAGKDGERDKEAAQECCLPVSVTTAASPASSVLLCAPAADTRDTKPPPLPRCAPDVLSPPFPALSTLPSPPTPTPPHPPRPPPPALQRCAGRRLAEGCWRRSSRSDHATPTVMEGRQSP